MVKNPILSIVIPTKNRYSTLIVVLETILEWKATNFELLIHDNSEDTSVIQPILEKYKNDTRLVYFHTTMNLTQAGNSNLAVKKSRGKYVCFIGDDDCILSKCIDLCYWMEKHKIESMSFKKARYVWPDLMNSIESEKNRGRLTYILGDNKKVSVNVKENVLNQIKINTHGMGIGPTPYHGIIKKENFIELEKNAGSFFPGPSPDIASSIGVSFFLSRHIYCELPYIISGQSFNSAAGLGVRKKHIGEIKNVKWLNNETADEWSDLIPFYWSGQTVTAESIIKTLEATGNREMIKEFNFNKLFALCLVYDKGYRYAVFQHCLKLKKMRIQVSFRKIIFEAFKNQLLRVLMFLNKRIYSNGKQVTEDKVFENIKEVTIFLDELLNSKHSKFISE